MVADKLSTLGQTIQTEWSLIPEASQATCKRWHQPFCNKVQQQASPVCVTSARPAGLGSRCTQPAMGNFLDPYAFPPAAILGKVVEKLQHYPCRRIILIAPGWPNMPWFWDLMAMSSEIPLSLAHLPNLLTQPFNQTSHWNPSNLNLHAWLLEPQQSRNRTCLRQWQHKLRLLREVYERDQSMR